MNKDFNRIKVVLAEKKRTNNGWHTSWGKIRLLFQNGAPMRLNRVLKLYLRLPNVLM